MLTMLQLCDLDMCFELHLSVAYVFARNHRKSCRLRTNLSLAKHEEFCKLTILRRTHLQHELRSDTFPDPRCGSMAAFAAPSHACEALAPHTCFNNKEKIEIIAASFSRNPCVETVN